MSASFKDLANKVRRSDLAELSGLKARIIVALEAAALAQQPTAPDEAVRELAKKLRCTALESAAPSDTHEWWMAIALAALSHATTGEKA